LENKTLVLGNGTCAAAVAENLLTTGIEVVIATKDTTCGIDGYASSGILEILTETQLISCKGSLGSFKVKAMQNHKPVTIDAGRIVIAEENQRTPNFSLYGLESSPKVITLSQLKNVIHDASHKKSVLSKIKRAVFLTSLAKESTPVIAKEVMLSSLLLQKDHNLQTYILTKNLKVAGDGLESLYRETKESGSVYVKFTDGVPDIRQDKDSKIRIEFLDEITSKKFRLTPDLIVVDETIVPSPEAAGLAEIFNIEMDAGGFVQGDNVHRYVVLTNRKGIMVAGPSRDILAYADQKIDAENTALAVTDLASEETEMHAEKAEVDEGQCIRCLTCYRLCPYHAITLNARVKVVPNACERCGICMAHCPRRAVRIADLDPGAMLDLTTSGIDVQPPKTFLPFIVAFCCRRSAAQARDLAMCMGHKLPKRLKVVEVPCSGVVSFDHIFEALGNDADGVMVLTCHKGNCHSEYGNIYAGHMAEQIQKMLSRIGYEKERFLLDTLASNMGTEFAGIANRFEETIVELGPNRLKKS
jgi:quinone-modifying oxidoreductase subunit QmoB